MTAITESEGARMHAHLRFRPTAPGKVLVLATLLLPSLAAGESHSPIASDDVAAFVERWRNCQNRGDFETYKTLYARGFYGVRRSGGRTVELNRDGWIKDRARMFRKPMTVEVADLTITASGEQAVAQFAQRWASGSYKDEGPKRLVVVREDGELRITREEMLASSLGTKAAEESAPGPAGAPQAAQGEVAATDQPAPATQAETPKAAPTVSNGDKRESVESVCKSADFAAGGSLGPLCQITGVKYKRPKVQFTLRLKTVNQLNDREYGQVEDLKFLWQMARTVSVSPFVTLYDDKGGEAELVQMTEGHQTVGTARTVTLTFDDARAAPETASVRRIRVQVNINAAR